MGYAAQQRVKSGFTWTDYGDKMVAVTCSPKAGPVTMRVRRPEMGTRRILDEEETHPTADRPHAARGRDKAGRRQLGPRDSQGARHQRGYVPPLESSLRHISSQEAKRLKELEAENARLKKLPAEKELDIEMLKELA